MLVYWRVGHFHFLLLIFKLAARLVVCDEKFDQRLHIGERDLHFVQHLSYLALHFCFFKRLKMYIYIYDIET